MSRARAILLGVAVAATAFGAGCGGGSADPQANLQQQAGGKLDAMKQLADAVGRNANQGELAGIVESFTSNTLDAKAHPDEARQIVEIYNTKVKGKLKGDLAAQVKGEIDGIERELKK